MGLVLVKVKKWFDKTLEITGRAFKQNGTPIPDHHTMGNIKQIQGIPAVTLSSVDT